VILTKYNAAFHIQCEKKESFSEGEQAGYQRGHAVGHAVGHAAGFEQGSDQMRRKMIHSMSANGVARQTICQSASITEEELDAILQEVSVG